MRFAFFNAGLRASNNIFFQCAMALGFEKMEKGSLGAKFQDRTNPMDKHMEVMMRLRGFEPVPPAPQMFGNAGREHMDKVSKNFGENFLVNHYCPVWNKCRDIRPDWREESSTLCK